MTDFPMSDFFDRIRALNSQGAYRAERVDAQSALKGGRHPVLPNPPRNAVLGTPLGGVEEFAREEANVAPSASETAVPARSLREVVVGMGCYWGAERLFWSVDGVLGTSVGFAGGYTPNPTYREVCTGRTGHAEVVRVVFDPERVTLEQLLAVMFENHDPTQGDRQGNDIGTQYRSVVYVSDDAQLATAQAAVQAWQPRFSQAGYGEITTEVALLREVGDGRYYLAEEEHQQYLHKNPGGYCNHGPNGVSCPTGVLGN